MHAANCAPASAALGQCLERFLALHRVNQAHDAGAAELGDVIGAGGGLRLVVAVDDQALHRHALEEIHP